MVFSALLVVSRDHSCPTQVTWHHSCSTRGRLWSLGFYSWSVLAPFSTFAIAKLMEILKLLTIVAKLSILDVCGAPGFPSEASCRNKQKKPGIIENQKQFQC